MNRSKKFVLGLKERETDNLGMLVDQEIDNVAIRIKESHQFGLYDDGDQKEYSNRGNSRKPVIAVNMITYLTSLKNHLENELGTVPERVDIELKGFKYNLSISSSLRLKKYVHRFETQRLFNDLS